MEHNLPLYFTSFYMKIIICKFMQMVGYYLLILVAQFRDVQKLRILHLWRCYIRMILKNCSGTCYTATTDTATNRVLTVEWDIGC